NYSRPPCRFCECQCFVSVGIKELLFPACRTKDGRTIGHTVEFLESERAEKGDEFFVTQYENRLLPSNKIRVFTPELIDQQTLYHGKQLPPVAPTVIMGDLAYFSEITDRDQTVFLVAKVFNGQLFVVDSVMGKLDAQSTAAELFNLVYKYRPRMIYIE